MPFYNYPRPAVTVDIVLFSEVAGDRQILLIQRKNEPFQNSWALPGGFVDENEALLDAALRELSEETSVVDVELQQFQAYGDAGRDPRGHTVSVVFIGIVDQQATRAEASDDANAARWFSISSLPNMAFDHEKIVRDILNREDGK